ncbi:RHS repeat-associated core domain-containing protein [Pseudomonas asplenii]|uniref:RHS repeat-associated core domain-containing protein n=1 Tax=Pseudomonas asplenii TaxID=53407 RepID=UPI00235E395E|nr:RHS repeat-associated core domain-containing protein [Pseudomonas asplenii]
MPSTDRSLLCRYRYDPLDCLTDYTPSVQANTQRFYLKDRLSTEIQGAIQRSIFQQEDQLLAQQQRQGGAVETTLLATDQQRSVLHALDTTQPHPIAYTPYGHRPPKNGLLSLLGFNGERPAPVTGHYLLGNGYRAFNPVLMRFNSPDQQSPFKQGGLNTYVYCLGDPINLADPTGQFGVGLIRLAQFFETIATHAENIVTTVIRARPQGFLGYAELANRAGYASVTTGAVLQTAGHSAGAALMSTGGALISVGSGMKAAHGTLNTLRQSRVFGTLSRRVLGKTPSRAPSDLQSVVLTEPSQSIRINIPPPEKTNMNIRKP